MENCSGTWYDLVHLAIKRCSFQHVLVIDVILLYRRCSVFIGLGTEFRSEKIPPNRLGTVSVIPRKKVLIPRHSEFRGRANSEARNGTKFRKKMNFYGNRTASMITLTTSTFYKKLVLQNRQNNLTKLFVRTSFSSVEWFGTEFREIASIFVLRNGIPS